MSDVKQTQKKGELHRHAGPLYLKDLNGCNGERKCSFIVTPISFPLTSRTNAFRNAPTSCFVLWHPTPELLLSLSARKAPTGTLSYKYTNCARMSCKLPLRFLSITEIIFRNLQMRTSSPGRFSQYKILCQSIPAEDFL